MSFSLAVLITYHNERELLRDCLSSLFASAERPDEVLVYDDASSAAAADYTPVGLPVRVIRGEINHGPSYGRNVLLRAARSEYIHFHDADDLFDARWCEILKKAIDSAADVVFTEISSYRDGELESERVLGLKRLLQGEDLTRFCIQGSMLTPGGTYRRECVLAIGGYREQLWQSEDFDFHVRLAASGVRHMAIDDPLVEIRIRSSSRSQNQVEVWSCALDAIRFLAQELDLAYHCDLAEKAAQVGSILHELGSRDRMREAFRLANELGPPKYGSRSGLYRHIAHLVGPEQAERLGAIYRRCVPMSSRNRPKRMGGTVEQVSSE